MSPRPPDDRRGEPSSDPAPAAGERAIRLVEASEVPEGRREVVGRALAQLLVLAASLEELPLQGVQPAAGEPRWQ